MTACEVPMDRCGVALDYPTVSPHACTVLSLHVFTSPSLPLPHISFLTPSSLPSTVSVTRLRLRHPPPPPHHFSSLRLLTSSSSPHLAYTASSLSSPASALDHHIHTCFKPHQRLQLHLLDPPPSPPRLCACTPGHVMSCALAGCYKGCTLGGAAFICCT